MGPGMAPPAQPLVVKPLTSPTPFGRVEPAGLQFTHSRKFRLQITALDYLVGEPSHKSGSLSKAGVLTRFFLVQFFTEGKGFFSFFWACFFFLSPKNIET